MNLQYNSVVFGGWLGEMLDGRRIVVDKHLALFSPLLFFDGHVWSHRHTHEHNKRAQ